MWIRKNEIENLSADIRKIIDGKKIDLRDNAEGIWGRLKNDIHTLAYHKNEQMDTLQKERTAMADTLVNISHQIKTPLTAMTIMADLIENALPDKQAEFLANIKAQLTRMEWFASALLKIAKLDAGAVEFVAEEISSDNLIAQALQPLEIILEVKNQTVKQADNILLSCDKRWSCEALTNLIKNASEASPEGGIIQIASGENPICKWLSVTDSGNGIEKSKMYSLFKRFEGTEKGYGVGLPLALAIMRGQNGDIEVNGGGSGQGATFTLKFYK